MDLLSAITGTVHEGQNHRMTNVTIGNFDVSYRECAEKRHICKNGAGHESMQDDPEITCVSHIYLISHALTFYWALPVCGLFVRHVGGFTLKDFHITPKAANMRPADNSTDPADRIDAEHITIQN